MHFQMQTHSTWMHICSWLKMLFLYYIHFVVSFEWDSYLNCHGNRVKRVDILICLSAIYRNLNLISKLSLNIKIKRFIDILVWWNAISVDENYTLIRSFYLTQSVGSTIQTNREHPPPEIGSRWTIIVSISFRRRGHEE